MRGFTVTFAKAGTENESVILISLAAPRLMSHTAKPLEPLHTGLRNSCKSLWPTEFAPISAVHSSPASVKGTVAEM